MENEGAYHLGGYVEDYPKLGASLRKKEQGWTWGYLRSDVTVQGCRAAGAWVNGDENDQMVKSFKLELDFPMWTMKSHWKNLTE